MKKIVYVETDASDLQRLGKNNLGGLRAAYGVRPVLATATRQPGRRGRKDVLAGNITVKSWRTQDDVPAVVTSENGLVRFCDQALKHGGKDTIFSTIRGTAEKVPCRAREREKRTL